MSKKEKIWLVLFGSIVLVFLFSGIYVLYKTQIDPVSSSGNEVIGLLRISYGFFLLTCMLLGMIANYWWDHFRSGKGWDDMLIHEILLPMFISPIVFFGIWSLWPGKEITFALSLIAFQNGFFWQVIFSKAGPVTAAPPASPSGG